MNSAVDLMTNGLPNGGMRRSEVRRFALFLLTGGLSASVNLGSRLVLSLFLPYEVSVAVAYLIGMGTAFLLFRRFVFERGRFWLTELKRFALVNVFAFCLVWVTSVVLARVAFPALGFTWHAETVAHLIGVMMPVASSYYGHKKYSFRQAAPLAAKELC